MSIARIKKPFPAGTRRPKPQQAVPIMSICGGHLILILGALGLLKQCLVRLKHLVPLTFFVGGVRMSSVIVTHCVFFRSS